MSYDITGKLLELTNDGISKAFQTLQLVPGNVKVPYIAITYLLTYLLLAHLRHQNK
jgi:hypothetical protein